MHPKFHRQDSRMCRQFLLRFLSAALHLVASGKTIGSVHAFVIPTAAIRSVSVGGSHSSELRRSRAGQRPLRNSGDDNDGTGNEPILSSASPNSAMSHTSRLSHAQLSVPSVDDSVAYWKSKGGRVVSSRSNGKTDGEAKLLAAFVTMGTIGGKKQDDGENHDDRTFRLELTKAKAKSKQKTTRNHGLSYLGLSMLLKFRDKNPLLDYIAGQSSTGQASDSKPNRSAAKEEKEDRDLVVKYIASAPGDGLAQLALVSDDKLVETCDFYTAVLGMDQKAQDQNVLCLRYDSPENATGVATTLVFENKPSAIGDNIELENGCFDHLAINTTSSIGGLYQTIVKENETKETNPVRVYMKPTTMFGSNLLGLLDPNGYRVVVFGSNP